tara:strand:- start:852 stop:1289 length:438 start_codon:yes stop_codon:yes gene_type:complete
MRLLLLVLLSFFANADKFDKSKLYSIFDEVKVRLGQVYYCDYGDPAYYVHKIDLSSEEMVLSDSGKVLGIQPITEIVNTKSTLRFRSPPGGGEGPVSDKTYWRKWYIDKITYTGNYNFFYPYPDGRWLDPIEVQCRKSIPPEIKK